MTQLSEEQYTKQMANCKQLEDLFASGAAVMFVTTLFAAIWWIWGGDGRWPITFLILGFCMMLFSGVVSRHKDRIHRAYQKAKTQT